jgi:phosphatidylinositol alpha 1,6-mannosyltransferase
LAYQRLMETAHQRQSAKVEQVFGGESALRPPDPAVELAPIRRVAIFAEAFPPKVDGVAKSAFLTLNYLRQTGREVLVFAPDNAPPLVEGSQVIALPSLGLPATPESRLALPHPMIAHYLDEFQPDMIHLFSPALLSMSGMIAGRLRHIPVIANYQTDLPAYTTHYGLPFLTQATRDALRLIHNSCHLTLVPSSFTLHQLQGWGFHRLRRWTRGVNSQHFNPERRSAEWRARLLNGRDPESLLCIYVGRLATEKRIDLLLDVAWLPGVALTIIGDGAIRADLETMFAGTDTHFTGYLLGDDLADAYASADVFLFPGISETFGQVVQEALASGLPSVIINQGGVTDLVKDGLNGYICPDDPLAFAAAARQLRDDPALRRKMAYNARRLAEQNPWEVVMARLEDYYREAVYLNERFIRVFQSSGLIPTLLNLGR